MLPTIHDFPNQLTAAWQLVTEADLALPERDDIDHIVILGMGGSAIGGDLVAGLAANDCPVPIHVHRNYGLPAWVGKRTLVIASSYSGNTEETLSGWAEAGQRGARRLAITTGGQLAEQANAPETLRFEYEAQPRAALGYSLTLLLGVIHRMGLTEDPAPALARFTTQAHQEDTIPPAGLRMMADELTHHCRDAIPVILAAEHLAAVARRWTTQINENSKAWAFWNEYPELDHNLIVGLQHPAALRAAEPGTAHCCIVHLASTHYHGQTNRRIDITRELMQKAGHRVETIRLDAPDRLEEVLWHTWLGDYLSLELARHYGADPSPVETIEDLKKALASD